MKKLFQSKRFRKNLAKWIFMYAGIMAFFTTVVTYSKYITKMGSSDTARVAKFNVQINYQHEACDVHNALTCNNGKHRPTETIYYDFVVDKSEIEVKTIMELTIYYLDEFKLVKLSKLDAAGNILVDDVALTTEKNNYHFEDFASSKYNYRSWNDNVNLDGDTKSYYRAYLTYQNDNDYKNGNYNVELNTLIVGYSAIQVK